MSEHDALKKYEQEFRRAWEDPEIRDLWLEAIGVMDLAKKAALQIGPAALAEIAPYLDRLEAKLNEKYPELDRLSGGNLHKIISDTIVGLSREQKWQGRKN